MLLPLVNKSFGMSLPTLCKSRSNNFAFHNTKINSRLEDCEQRTSPKYVECTVLRECNLLFHVLHPLSIVDAVLLFKTRYLYFLLPD